MKRRFRILAVAIYAAIMLAACDGSQGAATTTEPTKAEVKPTEAVAEPTKAEVEPTEAVAEPTETPTPEGPNPNEIDGVSFKRFNNGKDFQFLELPYEEPVIVATREHKALAVLHNGDSFIQEEPTNCEREKYYWYYFYSPKKIVDIKTVGNANATVGELGMIEEFGEFENRYKITVRIEPMDIDFTHTLTYDDGTSEEITIHISAPYPDYDENGEPIQY